MKRKFINSVAFLAFIAFPAFGMIRRTTVAPKVMSSVTPKIPLVPSVWQTGHLYSLPSMFTIQPTVSTFPSYDTSEKKYQWNQDSDSKNRWYNLKSFKYPLLATLGGISLKDSIDKQIEAELLEAKRSEAKRSEAKRLAEEWLEKKRFEKEVRMKDNRLKQFFEITQDAQDVDSELYEVFLRIKKDYGIKDNVQLRIMIPLDQLNEKQKSYKVIDDFHEGNVARYIHLMPPLMNIIILNSHYKSWHKSILIHIIAHELEHHRQNTKMKGSYHNTSRYIDRFINPKKIESNTKKFEIGADAAAADYQYCYKCLEEVGAAFGETSIRQHEPKETHVGYVTTPQGYFSKQDLRLWEDRAKEACALCPAHKTGTHVNPSTPLRDYLPPKFEE